jgi:hypothetical protein
MHSRNVSIAVLSWLLVVPGCYARSAEEGGGMAQLLAEGARDWRESCPIATGDGLCIRYQAVEPATGCLPRTVRPVVLARAQRSSARGLEKIRRAHAMASALRSADLDEARSAQRDTTLATAELYLADARLEEFLQREAAIAGAALAAGDDAPLMEVLASSAPQGTGSLAAYSQLAGAQPLPASLRARASSRAARAAHELAQLVRQAGRSTRIPIRLAGGPVSGDCRELEVELAPLESQAARERSRCRELARRAGMSASDLCAPAS